jgi:RND family efflux transporter MFP subunit
MKPPLLRNTRPATKPAAGPRLAASIPALLCGLLLFAGCGKTARHADSPSLPVAQVRVQAVADKSYLATEEVVGTVRARLRASVEAKVNGRIETMPVASGQSLKAGDLIARLDVREIGAKVDQAKAMRDQTEREFKRYEDLLRGKAVTRQEYEGVLARYRVAVAGVLEAETMLGYATITAPFDGVVTRKFADVGELATPGRPLIELEDPTSLRLEADVPETIIGGAQLGAKMPLRIGGVTNQLEGTVSEIAPSANPNSRTYLVKLDLPAAPSLRAGQFGRVALPVGQTTSPCVPASAVVLRGQMELVFVVTGQKAQLRLVKTGKRLGEEIELLSGVSPGEMVVVDGAATLVDGQPVQVKS